MTDADHEWHTERIKIKQILSEWHKLILVRVPHAKQGSTTLWNGIVGCQLRLVIGFAKGSPNPHHFPSGFHFWAKNRVHTQLLNGNTASLTWNRSGSMRLVKPDQQVRFLPYNEPRFSRASARYTSKQKAQFSMPLGSLPVQKFAHPESRTGRSLTLP